jgi:hypothetical protein
MGNEGIWIETLIGFLPGVLVDFGGNLESGMILRAHYGWRPENLLQALGLRI